jgi:hypothetical protein
MCLLAAAAAVARALSPARRHVHRWRLGLRVRSH